MTTFTTKMLAALCIVLALGLAPAAHAAKTINRSAPTITGTPATSVVVNTAYGFTPSAADADGSRLTFTIANKPAWASFTRSSGRLSGTPTVAGTHANIVISVSDGTYTASLPAFSITVTTPAPVIAAPVLTGTPGTDARVGLAYAFTPTASDPQGLPLTFAIANRPAWASFDAATGALTGTPTAADVGTTTGIVISASNGTRSTALPAFAITVQAVTGSATLTWEPPTTRTDGSALTNLAGYRIRYGTASGRYDALLDLNQAGLSAVMLENLAGGTWYFVVTAYDSAGAESAYSVEVQKTIS